MVPGPTDDEVRRRFRELLDDDLRDLAARTRDVARLFPDVPPPAAGARLRRPPLPETSRLVVRAELELEPPVRRWIALRSDVTLDRVHRVLQVAFDWQDLHLHRFSIGGEPFDRAAEVFLCPADAADPESAADGAPASTVRLDETLQQPGDELHYVYDSGDHWSVRVVLEGVEPAEGAAPEAEFLAGDGIAPGEDARGHLEAGTAPPSPGGPFDAVEADAALRDPGQDLGATPLDARLVALLQRLPPGVARGRLLRRAQTAAGAGGAPDPEAVQRALAPVAWLLDRAAEDGIALTKAGFLRPSDVALLVPLMPVAARWAGRSTRESTNAPLLHFRTSLQAAGLLRRTQDRLRLTRAGQAARRGPEALWQHLAARLVPGRADGFDQQAALLTLLAATDGASMEAALGDAAAALTSLGWSVQGDFELRWHDVLQSRGNPRDLLAHLDPPRPLGGALVGPIGAALAWAALRSR